MLVWVAAADAATYRSPGYDGTRRIPQTLPPTPPTPVQLGSGEKPSLLVDAAGTGHAVWNEGRGEAADATRYCRLKRGSTRCDAAHELVPTGPDDGRGSPLFNSEVGKPQVFALGNQVAVITHRYPQPFIGPDGNVQERSTWMFVSNDGGETFAPGVIVGTNEASGQGIAYGTPGAPRIGLISDTQTFGPYFQEITGARFETRQADLGDDGISVSLAAVGDSVIAAWSDLKSTIHVRQWNASGDISDQSSWTHASFPGDEPRLTSGPAGVFLISRPPSGGDRRYNVRPVAAGGTTFGAPVNIPGTESGGIRDVFEDPSGKLFVTYRKTSDDTGREELLATSSTDGGRTWSTARALRTAAANERIHVSDTAATGDGGGFALTQESATAGAEGPIRAIAFGPQTATGVQGLGDEPGGAAPPDVVEACARAEFGAVDIVLPEGCLLGVEGQRNVRVAEGTIKLNGLEIVPEGNAKVLLNARARTIDSSGTVRVQLRAPGITPIVLFRGDLHLSLPAELRDERREGGGPTGGCGGQRLADFGGDIDVKGFPVKGGASVFLGPDASCIPISLELPKAFGGIRGAAVLRANNKDGLVLDSLKIEVGSAWLGPVLISDVLVEYTRTGDSWEGAASIGIPPQPGPLVVKGRIRFEGGKFKSGSISIPLGYPGIQIGPFPAYLYRLGGGFGVDPVFIEASASVGVIPTPPGTYVVGVDGTLRLTFGDPITFEAHGTGSLYGLQVARVAFFLALDGFVRATGELKLDFSPVFSATGMVDIFVDLPNGEFGATAGASACITFVCGDTEVVISTIGFAACVDPPLPPLVEFFFGHEWGDPPWVFDLNLVECDMEAYRPPTPVRGGLAPAQAGARAFNVEQGTKAVNLRLSSGDESRAPDIVLISPTGERITPAKDLSVQAQASALSSRDRTFVGIREPAAGNWQVETVEGSAPIAEMMQANDVPEPEVAGSVGGKGRSRILSYRATTGDGLETTFAEKGKFGTHVIGTARGTRGTLKFTPAQGPRGRRTIVAIVERGGKPRLEKEIASYVAPPPAKPGKVAGLKLKRRGTTITATWKRLRGIAGYGVRVDYPDGRRELQVLKRGARRLVVKRVPRRGRVTVHVQGRDQAGRAGRAVRVSR